MADMEIYQRRGNELKLFAKGAVANTGSGSATSGVDVAEVNRLIDAKIQALPADEVSTVAKVEEIVDDKLKDFTPPEAGVDEEAVKEIVADEVANIKHPKKIWFFDTDAEMEAAKSEMATDDIGFVGTGAFDMLKGADGINGKSGFAPDFNKKMPLEMTSASQNVDGYTYSGYFCQAAPDDGYILVSSVGSATTTTIVFHKDTNGDLTRLTMNSDLSCLYYMQPVAKGDVLGVFIYKTTFKNCSFIFIPVHRPEFTEEHVIGYVNDKPLYEVYVSAVMTSDVNKWSYIANIPENIAEVFAVYGTHQSQDGGWSCSPYAAPSGSSTILMSFYCDLSNNKIGVKTNSSLSGRKMKFVLQYTKTTD